MIRRKIKFSHHYDVPFNQKEIVFVSYRHIDSDICNAVLEQLFGWMNISRLVSIMMMKLKKRCCCRML